MDGKAITAAIRVARQKRAVREGADAREKLRALITQDAAIPKRQAQKYYAWLAEDAKYDVSFRWANGSFRKAGVWSALANMAPRHLDGLAPAFLVEYEGPSNFAQRPVLHFACAEEPRDALQAPDESIIVRFAAIATLCMAPKKPTKAFTTKLEKLSRDETVMVGAWWVCEEATDTVLYSDVELAHGLLGLLAVHGGKRSKSAVREVLAFAETDAREGRLIMLESEANAAAKAYR